MRLLRIGVLALLAVPFAAAAGGKAAPPQTGCRAPVRGVPFALPAPLTIKTRCGSFELERDGRVLRVPNAPSPVARQANMLWESGAWVGSSQGHLLVGRAHHTLWRSRSRFKHEYEVEVLALGGQALAFSYGLRSPELFVARFGGRERRVAPRELPLGWSRSGLYTRRGETLLLRSADGRLLRTIARNTVHAAYDTARHGLWFVAGGRLFRAQGRSVRRLAEVARVGVPAGRTLHLEGLGKLLGLVDRRRLVVLRPDGSVFASTPLPQAHDTLVSASPTAAPDSTEVAFATMRPDHRIETQVFERGVESVYLLRSGVRTAVAVHTKHVWFNVCGHGANLSWHGSWLLYSASEGDTALIDTRHGRTIGLSSFVHRLPGFKADDSGSFRATWG